jgi:hypothetical protein
VSNISDARVGRNENSRWPQVDHCRHMEPWGFLRIFCNLGRKADAEARRRNGPHLTVVGEDYTGDDDIPF